MSPHLSDCNDAFTWVEPDAASHLEPWSNHRVCDDDVELLTRRPVRIEDESGRHVEASGEMGTQERPNDVLSRSSLLATVGYEAARQLSGHPLAGVLQSFRQRELVH